MEKPEVRAEHRWLQRLVGEWRFESEEWGHAGTESARMLGEVWLLIEAVGQEDGNALWTLGYDPAAGRFVGSFVASLTTHHWIYDKGWLEGDRLHLESDGPSMKGDGPMDRYRDVIELQGDDRRTLTAFVREEDGSWRQFMTVAYRRTG